MTDDTKRKLALDRIRENIARTGHHIYLVAGGAAPRFAYTIGVSESMGAELILAGASFYPDDQVAPIIDDIVAQLKRQRAWEAKKFKVDEHGSFTLRKAHASWAPAFLLGALAYYQVREIPALQLVPDEAHWTIDVPDLSAPRSAAAEPAWRWLHEPWTYPVPKDAGALTNLAALRGERVTRAMRWEEDKWEILAGTESDIRNDESRIVPLGTLLAADESLVPAVHLPIGEGLWRDAAPGSEWHPWREREPEGAAGSGKKT